jgi:hypothetical protein
MSIRSILAAFGLVVSAGVWLPSCGSSDESDTCAAGSILKEVCVQCGQAGGCGKQETKCVATCSSAENCKGDNPLVNCYDGVCQVGGCI